MNQQIVNFEELFDKVKCNGVYLCEDVHTSDRLKFGGGYKRKGIFIEYSKNFIDSLKAYHSRQKTLEVSSFTKTVDSIHYYDSVVVVEKKTRSEKSGQLSFKYIEIGKSLWGKRIVRFKNKTITVLNKTLQFLRLRDVFLK